MKKVLFYVILIFAAIIMIYPILFTIVNSFMSEAEILDRYSTTITPTNSFDVCYQQIHFVRLGLLPDVVIFRQYLELFFFQPDILLYFWNSVFLMVCVVLGHCLVSVPAGYAFEYGKWKWKEVLFFVYCAIMLMPLQVVLVPNYIVANWLDIKDSYLAIILPGIFAPFGTFLIRQQLRGFPKDYQEASQLDGASPWSYFAYVILPTVKPTVGALAVLTFVEYWNMVDQAVVFIRDSSKLPMSVFLSSLMSDNTGMLFVTSVFYMLPAVFVFLFGEKQMIHGIQLSGIKG